MRRKEIESIGQEVQHPPDSDASTARASRDFVAELKRRKAKLEAAGVTSVDELLERGATPKGRKAPAAKSGVPAGQLLKFVKYADLFRIKGSAAGRVKCLMYPQSTQRHRRQRTSSTAFKCPRR